MEEQSMVDSHTQTIHLTKLKMKTTSTISAPISFFLLLIFSSSYAASDYQQNRFLQCLSRRIPNYSSISNNVYTPTNSSYTSVLQFSIRNLRFISDSTPKPQVIITPQRESQIPPIIYCAKQTDLQIRTRSGGHDFEGLSYVSKLPFLVIDMINLDTITVDVHRKTAWAGTGANIGSLYYAIAQKSSVLAFPAAICPTVGLGGLFSGGGYGYLMRKFGLAADHVIDARIVDVNGRILDRNSMGEDLFWAIRGGGASSFGVILAWKIQLVDIPEKITVFHVYKTLEQNATQLVQRWQYIAPQLDPELFLGVTLKRVNSTENERNMTILASFFALYIGAADKLLPLVQEIFPELGLVREDCVEMKWIEAMVHFNGFPANTSLEVLRNRASASLSFFKSKTDYVQKPIGREGLEGLWRQLYAPEAELAQVLLQPYGGRMAEIAESAIPFPHRAGNLYMMGSGVYWPQQEGPNSERYMNWMRGLHNYSTPYVSKSPRAAYANYRDLDLGANNDDGTASYAQASIWGRKYYKNNFDRLVKVKTMVDPENFFRHEQSIPPFTLAGLISDEIQSY